MKSANMTVMLVVPGRRTVSLEVTQRWPTAVVAALLVPLLMGAAARRCADAFAGVGQTYRVAAHDVTGSLAAVSSASVLPRVAPRRAAPALMATTVVARPQRPRRSVDAPLLTAVAPQRRPVRAPALVAATERAVEPRRSPPRAPSPAVVAPSPDGLSTSWLRVTALHLGESIRVHPFDASGAVDPLAFGALRHLMRCRITGTEIDIDPRLVRILTAISATYNRGIQLVSGHRQPHLLGTSSTSQHTLGKAADIRVAGVSVEELRGTALKFGARGVGVYPEKGFVHVDVRDKKYRWTYTQAEGEVRDLR